MKISKKLLFLAETRIQKGMYVVEFIIMSPYIAAGFSVRWNDRGNCSGRMALDHSSGQEYNLSNNCLAKERNRLSMKKYSAELVGTLVLVLMGCGAAVIAGNYIGIIGISFAFGLTLLAMMYMIGNISGCHINPAITVAMLVTGKMKGKDAGFYVLAQFIGGIIGAGLVWVIARGNPSFNLATNGLFQNGFDAHSPLGYSLAACFIAEVILTAILLLVYLGSTSKIAHKGFASIAVGVTFLVIYFIGIPITSASFNPARSLGPAVFVGGDALTQIWLFIVAPIIGGIIGAVVWKYFFEEEELPDLPEAAEVDKPAEILSVPTGISNMDKPA